MILLHRAATRRHQVASRAECTAFVQGPRSPTGVPVTVRWPGRPIAAVVAGDRRLRLHRPLLSRRPY